MLYNGDAHLLLPTIKTASIDAVIADPPFGTNQGKKYHQRRDEPLNWQLIWKELLRITKPNSPIVLFAQQPFTSELVMAQREIYRHNWIWQRNKASNFLNPNRPLNVIQDIVVFGKKTVNYYPIVIPLAKPVIRGKTGKPSAIMSRHKLLQNRVYKHRLPINVLQFPSPHRALPYQKPLELMEYLVKTYSKENDLILDFTMGTGTTIVAAKNLNRQYIGIERDQAIYDIALKRVGVGVPNSLLSLIKRLSA